MSSDLTPFLPHAPLGGQEGRRTLADIETDLARPIDPALLKTKPKAGQKLTYIEWHTAVRILSRYAPGWQERITVTVAPNGRVICTVELGLPTADQGMVWRGNVGTDQEDDDPELHPDTGEVLPTGYRWNKWEKRVERKPEPIDPATPAYAQAFKRAAAMFGLGLYLYSKDGSAHPGAARAPEPARGNGARGGPESGPVVPVRQVVVPAAEEPGWEALARAGGAETILTAQARLTARLREHGLSVARVKDFCRGYGPYDEPAQMPRAAAEAALAEFPAWWQKRQPVPAGPLANSY